MPDQNEEVLTVRYWHDRLALFIALGTLVAQFAFALWWGGRFTQRFEYVENNQKAFERTLDSMEQKDISHDVSLATINAQYTEIINRLERIERTEK